MNLAPTETDLVGHWVKKGGRVSGDAVELRIQWLIDNWLEKISVGNWTVLYRDSADGRFWELTYPQGEMHGGGPKRLTVISPDQVKAKYPEAGG